MSILLVFVSGMLATMILILLGNGVTANCVLKNTKANNGGWLTVATGWGLALGVALTFSTAINGLAHTNFAFTIAYLVNGWTQNVGPFSLLPFSILGQITGIIIGQLLLNLIYIKHIIHTNKENQRAILLMHATIPQYDKKIFNFIVEFIATAVILIVVFTITKYNWFENQIYVKPMFIGFTGIAIDLCLGGPTGAAINPLRDIIPRAIFSFLPLKNKHDPNWNYAWIPFFAPICAGITIGALFLL